jgi:hypothetical protein
MSVDYYVRLEQGRDLTPSPSVLDALARALRLNDVEREHLYSLVRHRVRLPSGTACPPPVAATKIAARGGARRRSRPAPPDTLRMAPVGTICS